MPRRLISKIQFMSLYNSGMTDGEIAEALDFTKSGIRDLGRRLELPPHRKVKEKVVRERKPRIKKVPKEKPPRGIRKHKQNLIVFLREHGPALQTDLSAELRIPFAYFSRLAREMFDDIERFRLVIGGKGKGRGGIKYKSSEIYGELSKMGPIFAIRNDPRIIDFIAQHVPFKIETPRNAQALVMHFKRHIGTERAQEVVRRLGYIYSKDNKSRVRVRSKFTDEQLLELYKQELYDHEMAERLGVSTSAITQRRKLLKLPSTREVKGKRGERRSTLRTVYCPQCGHSFEISKRR